MIFGTIEGGSRIGVLDLTSIGHDEGNYLPVQAGAGLGGSSRPPLTDLRGREGNEGDDNPAEGPKINEAIFRSIWIHGLPGESLSQGLRAKLIAVLEIDVILTGVLQASTLMEQSRSYARQLARIAFLTERAPDSIFPLHSLHPDKIFGRDMVSHHADRNLLAHFQDHPEFLLGMGYKEIEAYGQKWAESYSALSRGERL